MPSFAMSTSCFAKQGDSTRVDRFRQMIDLLFHSTEPAVQLLILIMDEALVLIALLAHLRVHDAQHVVAGGENADLIDQRGLNFAFRERWR